MSRDYFSLGDPVSSRPRRNSEGEDDRSASETAIVLISGLIVRVRDQSDDGACKIGAGWSTVASNCASVRVFVCQGRRRRRRRREGNLPCNSDTVSTS